MKYVSTFILCIIASLFIQVNEVTSHESIEMIPDEAIRLRILANSNHASDQNLKLIVRDNVSLYVSELVKEMKNIDDARQVIAEHVDEIEEIVEDTLQTQGKSDSSTVSFRKNVPFPEKNYDNYLYPEGLYEAILITIGDGKGDNWWCVLFPPLCFVEFSTEEINDIEGTNFTEQENDNNDENDEEPVVSFFLFEWLGFK